MAYHALGRKKEADKVLELYSQLSKDQSYRIAEIYAFRGEKDKAFEWLEKSYARKQGLHI